MKKEKSPILGSLYFLFLVSLGVIGLANIKPGDSTGDIVFRVIFGGVCIALGIWAVVGLIFIGTKQTVNPWQVSELVRLVGSDGGFANKRRIREIGEDLNRKGDIEFMRLHYYAVKKQVYFSEDIWDGIGSWRC